jgi:hypothetical protein
LGSRIPLDLIEPGAGNSGIDQILQLMNRKIDMRPDLPGNIEAIEGLDNRLKLPQHFEIGLLAGRMVLDVHVRLFLALARKGLL